MQITAGHCLGLLAWDKRDRATAAKRYKETLEFTDTIPGMSSLSPNSKHLEYCVQIDVKEMRENLERILYNDGVNLALLNQTDAERRTNIAVPNVRMEFDGTITQEQVVMVASDACKACGKRDVKLSRCQKCKTAHCKPSCSYCVWTLVNLLLDCGVDCQRADWRFVTLLYLSRVSNSLPSENTRLHARPLLLRHDSSNSVKTQDELELILLYDICNIVLCVSFTHINVS